MAKILIVDDDKDVVEFTKFALEKQGYEVVPIYNGNDGLIELKKKIYNLAILDIMLPGLDGFNIQLELDKDKILKNLPIIVISGLKPAEKLFERFTQVKGFFLKPFNIKDLISRVEEILKTDKD
ncbi:MAG: response regulator [bacterium]